MLYFICLYAALHHEDFAVRESATRQLHHLVDRHPQTYGPRLSELLRGATEPEVLARGRRIVAVYDRWRVASFKPSSCPVWPICDASVIPTMSGDIRCKDIGMAWYDRNDQCDPAVASGPFWFRYRLATARWARSLLVAGESPAEVDAMLGRMWECEKRVYGDCGQEWARESVKWTKWEGGFPHPR